SEIIFRKIKASSHGAFYYGLDFSSRDLRISCVEAISYKRRHLVVWRLKFGFWASCLAAPPSCARSD
ncbi:hypothetical protein pipiens_000990, partial [Culex pipiens pipiens]